VPSGRRLPCAFRPRTTSNANLVVAYYNYVNRVAEGLGVELEGYWPAQARERRTYRGRTVEGRLG
jgi:hypothetical protein